MDRLIRGFQEFFKWANPGLFVYFRLFHVTQFKYKLLKA